MSEMKLNSFVRMQMFRGIGCFLHLFDHAKKNNDTLIFKNILLIRTHALGDVLLTTPAIRVLRLRFPEAHLSFLVAEGAKAVIENNPNIDKIISFPDSLLVKFSFLPFLRLLKKLRREKYDCVISFSRSAGTHLLAFLTGSPVRVGLDFQGSGFPLSLKVPDKKSNVADKEQCAVEDYLDIVKILCIQKSGTHLDFFLTSEGTACVENFLYKVGISSRDLVIGIFPGGCDNPAEKVSARRWPVQKYAQLADILIRELSAKVIVLGGNKDVRIILQMLSLMKEKAVNGGNIGNLNTFGHLLKRCSLLITNDSLPMHLALSLNIPTVAPFGPTNSKVYLTSDNCLLFSPVQSSLECSPCYWKERFRGCKKYSSPKCMDAISISEVFEAIKKLLQVNHKKTKVKDNPFFVSKDC